MAANPEQYIDCCEWCGNNTRHYGRWELRSGAGLKIILCSVCARDHEPLRYGPVDYNKFGDGTCLEMVPCQR
jgi:hypothetical protein